MVEKLRMRMEHENLRSCPGVDVEAVACCGSSVASAGPRCTASAAATGRVEAQVLFCVKCPFTK